MNSKITHILLAEDDEDDCLLFTDVLKELSIAVKLTIANNGERLMSMLKKLEKSPDMIFLDLNMPRKNGFECLEEIKQDDRLRDMPVIILSTTAQPTAVEQVYKQGANLYITKPSNFRVLKKVILHVLSVNWKTQPSRPPQDEFVLSV